MIVVEVGRRKAYAWSDGTSCRPVYWSSSSSLLTTAVAPFRLLLFNLFLSNLISQEKPSLSKSIAICPFLNGFMYPLQISNLKELSTLIGDFGRFSTQIRKERMRKKRLRKKQKKPKKPWKKKHKMCTHLAPIWAPRFQKIQKKGTHAQCLTAENYWKAESKKGTICTLQHARNWRNKHRKVWWNGLPNPKWNANTAFQ